MGLIGPSVSGSPAATIVFFHVQAGAMRNYKGVSFGCFRIYHLNLGAAPVLGDMDHAVHISDKQHP